MLGLATLGCAQDSAGLVDVQWTSTHTAPPPELTGNAKALLPAFRASLSILPESAIIALALSQPQLLDLPRSSAQQMAPLISQRYERIASDPLFGKAASVMGYCYGETKPTQGFARIYCPPHHSSDTTTLVFLHGYGGSFIWYQHWLVEHFKDCLIICPAYGINPSTIPPAYLAECMAAATRKLGHPLARPWLIGLSAGGFGVQRVFSSTARNYQGLIVLAAYPWDRSFITSANKDSRVCFLAGEREVFVTDGTWTRSLSDLKRHAPTLKSRLVPQADHFFMLTHPDQTTKWFEDFIGR